VTVDDPTGHRLKIPSWMLSPEAERYRLSDEATISPRALLWLSELLEPVLTDLGVER
jgi:hypothetical protein